MAHLNIEEMSLPELKELQKEVNRAVATYEDRRRRDALVALEATARTLGFSVAELTGIKMPKIKASGNVSQPKFANPAKPAETWTGRGRQPQWFKDGIAAGKSPDEFAI